MYIYLDLDLNYIILKMKDLSIYELNRKNRIPVLWVFDIGFIKLHNI